MTRKPEERIVVVIRRRGDDSTAMSTYRQPFSRAGRGAGSSAASASSSMDAKARRRVELALPAALRETIETRKVDVEAMKPWISTRVTELLGVEDEVLIGMIEALLEEERVHRSGARMYGQLTSFLEKSAEKFCVELWTLLKSAQDNYEKDGPGVRGIPSAFVRDKAAETRRADEAYARVRAKHAAREGDRGGEFHRRRQKPYDDRRPRQRDGSRDRGDGDRRRRDSRSPSRRRSRWARDDAERSDG